MSQESALPVVQRAQRQCRGVSVEVLLQQREQVNAGLELRMFRGEHSQQCLSGDLQRLRGWTLGGLEGLSAFVRREHVVDRVQVLGIVQGLRLSKLGERVDDLTCIRRISQRSSCLCSFTDDPASVSKLRSSFSNTLPMSVRSSS